jgi:hypothetical protein
MNLAQWYEQHGCDHAHCPEECDHPQPFIDEATGDLLCGGCWFRFGRRSVMIPCTPEACD